MDIQKMIAEKKELQKDIALQLNDFQEKYNINVNVEINETHGRMLGSEFISKEVNLKVEL